MFLDMENTKAVVVGSTEHVCPFSQDFKYLALQEKVRQNKPEGCSLESLGGISTEGALETIINFLKKIYSEFTRLVFGKQEKVDEGAKWADDLMSELTKMKGKIHNKDLKIKATNEVQKAIVTYISENKAKLALFRQSINDVNAVWSSAKALTDILVDKSGVVSESDVKSASDVLVSTLNDKFGKNEKFIPAGIGKTTIGTELKVSGEGMQRNFTLVFNDIKSELEIIDAVDAEVFMGSNVTASKVMTLLSERINELGKSISKDFDEMIKKAEGADGTEGGSNFRMVVSAHGVVKQLNSKLVDAALAYIVNSGQLAKEAIKVLKAEQEKKGEEA